MQQVLLHLFNGWLLSSGREQLSALVEKAVSGQSMGSLINEINQDVTVRASGSGEATLTLSEGRARTIAKYEMNTVLSERGSLIIYLDKVSHTRPEEITFRVHQTLKVGVLQPAAVSVYEYYEQKHCVKFYHPERRSGELLSLCRNDECTCAEAAQGQNDWEVTYTSTKICALKGSTVDINCTYSSRVNGHERTFWFTKSGNYEFADLRTELEYAGRVQYHFDENNYTLRITDLKESDSAEYKLITNQPGERLTGSPGVTLSVTDLQVQVIRSYYVTTLKCHSSCHIDSFSSYIWYKNGWEISRETSSYYKVYRPDFNPADSYSCAVKGHEDFPSPLVCVFGQSCNKVTYTDRSICAFRGSSVDISCTYTSCESNIKSTLWFCPERSRQWLNPSQPEDLSKDSQYAGRVQLLKTKGGSSILRISDLRENDSAQYRFTFQTQSSKWRSTLPGTTLTVTAYPALWVQVTTIKYHPSYTEAELKCLSGCVLPCCDSYIWFKNGQKIKKEETALYSGQFVTGDKISCALKGYENYSSPLYAPQLTSVSVSPSGEIIEGSTVTLICRENEGEDTVPHSDAEEEGSEEEDNVEHQPEDTDTSESDEEVTGAEAVPAEGFTSKNGRLF
ncbi:hypothetical protein PAMA_016131 [Pampus argenteus]